MGATTQQAPLRVAVRMGAENDREVVAPALDVLDECHVGAQWRVLSAHRTPDAVAHFSRETRGRGIGVIIAAASGAAHLAGVDSARNAALLAIAILAVSDPQRASQLTAYREPQGELVLACDDRIRQSRRGSA